MSMGLAWGMGRLTDELNKATRQGRAAAGEKPVTTTNKGSKERAASPK